MNITAITVDSYLKIMSLSKCSIINFLQLDGRIANSGQPTEDQFEWIADGGYETVINLGMPNHKNAVRNEGSIIADYGMTYISIPVPFTQPEPRHVKQFCELMYALEGQKIWVHCILNYRVSAFMYHYLEKIKGENKETALSLVFDEWSPDDIWKAVFDWTKKDIGL